MQTHQVIQSSANVVRLVSLSKGNIYKRMHHDYGDQYAAVYGVVVDIMNDGDKTFIEALEYKKEYSSVTAELKVFHGGSDINIFPASLEEMEQHFRDAIDSIEREIVKKEEELCKQRKSLTDAKKFAAGEMAKQLSEASFETMSQAEYQPKKELPM